MKKYCSLCKQPLANNNCIVCDKCGKPTTPIDIFDKMASDNCLDSKEKRMLELIGILNIISCVISMIEWLILTAVLVNIRSALQEQMNAGLIVETAENLAAYQSTLSMCGLMSTLGIIVIVEQLAALFFSVMILLKRAWAVQVSRVLYIINIIIHFLSGNIISAIITIYIVVKLNAIISKMDGGAEYTAVTMQAEKEEAELAADPTKWRCKSCGFINSYTVSECKSCGKWKN